MPRLSHMTFPQLLGWFRHVDREYGRDEARAMYRYLLDHPYHVTTDCGNRRCGLPLVASNSTLQYPDSEIRLACGTCDQCERHCECIACEGCGRRYDENDANFCDHGYCAQRCDCDQCADNEDEDSACLVRHTSNALYFHKSTKPNFKINKSKRFVSVEIEVAKVREGGRITDTVDNWLGCIVHDGSLPSTGFEINTAPANGDSYVNQIVDICDVLNQNGAEVTDACGLHAHIDARDFSYYDIQNLCLVYARIEKHVFGMVPESRATGTYSMPCGDRLVPYKMRVSNKEAKKNLFYKLYGQSDGPGIKDMKADKYNQSRYNALNLHSWLFRGTVEVRMFNGSTNSGKIIAWGKMWASILDYVKAKTDVELLYILKQLDGYSMLLEMAPDKETIDFINARLMLHGTDKQKAEVIDYQNIKTLSEAA